MVLNDRVVWLLQAALHLEVGNRHIQRVPQLRTQVSPSSHQGVGPSLVEHNRRNQPWEVGPSSVERNQPLLEEGIQQLVDRLREQNRLAQQHHMDWPSWVRGAVGGDLFGRET